MTSRFLVAGFAVVLAGLAGHSAIGQDRDSARQKGPGFGNPNPRTEVRIMTLRDSDSVEMARTLRELFSGDDVKKIRLALHSSTNSIVITGATDELDKIEAVVKRLDDIAAEKKVARPDGKQPKIKPPKDLNEIKLLEAAVEQSKERAAWAERMVKLGYASAAQGTAERARLEAAQIQLQQALRELAAAEAVQKPAAAARAGWEFKVLELRMSEDRWEAEMNKLGADGWEFAEVVVGTHNGTSATVRMLFKRAK